MIDFSSDFGARAAAHLRDDVVVWLTTVGESAAPLPTCVWFLWDGEETVRIQSLPTAKRVDHLAAGHDRVSLNFPGDGGGGDIVVFSGRAQVVDGAAMPDAYVEKYRDHITRIGLTPDTFGERYGTAIDVTLTRLRGH